MNKNIIYSFVMLAVSVLFFSSCDEDETTRSTVASPAAFNIEELTPTAVTVPERATEENIIVVDFTLDENQIFETEVEISVDPASTATEDVDFHLSTHSVTIPAFIRSGSFAIDIVEDFDAEGTEDIIVNLSGVQNPYGISETRQVNVSIQDSVSSTLLIAFTWEGEIPLDVDGDGELDVDADTGELIGYSRCAAADMDAYVTDEDGNDLGFYGAATGDCPEVFDTSVFTEDGEYYLQVNFWSFAVPIQSGVDFPVNVDVIQAGVGSDSFTQSEENWLTSDDPRTGEYEDFAQRPLIKVTVSGGVHTWEAL